MKTAKKLIPLLAVLSVAACTPTNRPAEETLTVDELLASAESRIGDTIRVEGLCVSTCGHGSTHITLMGSDTTQMIEALADDKMRSFDPTISNRTVAVEGNPEAVAVLKKQIRELRDSIAARKARDGKEYWSIYRIETFACHATDDSSEQ